MRNEIIVLTHNDLDALGCMANVEFKYPHVKKYYYHTNYSDIPGVVENAICCAGNRNIQTIFVLDVSFSQHPEELSRICEHFKNVVYVDHHQYPEGFFQEYVNRSGVLIVHDVERSATALCADTLGNVGKNRNLDKLTKLIDIYDLWQTESRFFGIAQDFNDYFWHSHKYLEIEPLLSRLVKKDYSLPDDYAEVVERVHETRERDIAKFEADRLIHRVRELTVAFVNKWETRIQIAEAKKGQKYFVFLNNRGIVRVRIAASSDLSDTQKRRFCEILTGHADYGHLDAFTYKIPDTGFDALTAEAKRVVDALNSVMVLE